MKDTTVTKSTGLQDAMQKATDEFEKEIANGDKTRIQSKAGVRAQVLAEAAKLITGDRASAYGNYGDQMRSIADMFNAMHAGVGGEPKLEGRHVSTILQLLKMRRRVTAQDVDSSIDLCGYTALDAEFFTKPRG